MSATIDRALRALVLAGIALALVALPESAPRAATAPEEPEVRRLEPVDEASKDPSFATFRAALLAAVERRDARYVRRIVDPGILNDFGGNDGARAFEKTWRLAAADSKLWHELREALTHGGSFEAGEFWAPYVFSRFPEDLDAFEYSAVLDDGVVLRERPDASAPAVATLSYHIVKVDTTAWFEAGRPDWYAAATTDGRAGYVPVSSVRSPIDYRACFAKRRGVWRMTAFLAGD